MAATCADATAAEPVDFNRDIRPILSDKCFACHGPDKSKRQAELRLDTKTGAFAKRDDGHTLVPGDLAKSLLFGRITAADEEERMPPADSGRTLSAAQIELIGRWIKQGA
ncbi:MAG: hypothetical protein IIA67_14500, partial [Planctomycetes bacterium]|nr:hypothetical protein [Planctomycetota bacterium]